MSIVHDKRSITVIKFVATFVEKCSKITEIINSQCLLYLTCQIMSREENKRGFSTTDC